MNRLMELLNDGRAWSVADLANSLREPQKEVQRRVESLESNGYLRKDGSCPGNPSVFIHPNRSNFNGRRPFSL